MNRESCPGPDSISFIIFDKAGLTVQKYYTSILNACLKTGHFPKPWKRENRIYIKKANKENYHTEKSYRPLSLSNIMAKIFERIMMNRIAQDLTESKFFKGKSMFAYQKGKSSAQALLHLVQNMHDAVTKKKVGGAFMTDLEGAYDSTWREGVIYKLYMAGISGNMLRLCHSFLNNRQSRNLVNSHVSDW